jgi:hypothetical protein
MTAIAAFRKSTAGATSSVNLLFTLYLINVLLAIPAAALFRHLTTAAFGASMAGGALLPGFDNTVVNDLLTNHEEIVRSLIGLLAPLMILGAMFNTFLAGGILSRFVQEEKFSFTTFIRGCGAYFGRFFRLTLLMVLIEVLLVLLLSIPFSLIVGAIGDGGGNEETVFLATIAAVLVVYSPILLVVIAADYARVATVVYDLRSILKAIGQGFAFVFRNIGATIGLHLLLLALLLLAVVGYWILEGAVDMGSAGTIAVGFVLQQFLVLARTWSRLSFFAGEAALYERRKPRPVIFYGWDDSPAPEAA